MKLYSTVVSTLVFGASAIAAITGGLKTAQQTDSAVYNLVTTVETTTESTTFQHYDTAKLSNEKQSWFYVPNDKHLQPGATDKVDLKKYNAYYLGNEKDKVIYLTFDEGYENGYSSKILDVLKSKNVKAAFFVTKSYIDAEPDLIKRMVNEGHVVGNHSVHHLSSPTLSEAQMKAEITNTAAAFKNITGKEMPKVFRPPMGEYSEKTLAITNNLGYKTIFWSFAYRDWLTDAQPGKAVAFNTVMSKYHNGAVLLLHAVSSSNTEALGDIIDNLRAKGYTFASLENIK